MVNMRKSEIVRKAVRVGECSIWHLRNTAYEKKE